MSNGNYAEHDLRISKDTEPEDIREFLDGRFRNPIELEEQGVVVWDFSTHYPDMDALRGAAANLEGDRYVIPFQLAAPWAYMQDVLPSEIRRLPILAYSEKFEMYREHKNFKTVADGMKDTAKRSELQGWLEQYDS